MPPTLQELGIDRLSVDERIAVAQAIWQSVADDAPPSMLNDSQRNELRLRLADHALNPDDVVPWDDIEAGARARWTT